MDEMRSTKNFFKSHHITLSDYWLQSCLEWLREENPNENYTLETLHSLVYAQWLLLDLRDVEIAILPDNIVQQKKTVLNDNYCLQMLQIQDISQPKYQQLQKIRNCSLLADAAVNQEYKPVVTAKRMLQMSLTDGVQKIEAIEYKTIPALNINLKPGTKIRVQGPVTVRRGQFFLEEKNVFVLGGEVEEILVSNAYENVLARALKLPENPTPTVVEEVELVNEEVPRPVTNVRNNTIDQYLGNRNLSSTSTTKLNSAVNSSNANERLEEYNDEIDELLEAERDIAGEAGIAHQSDDDIFLIPEKNIPKPSTSTEKTDCGIDDSMFEGIDVDAYLDMIDEQQECAAAEVVPIMNLLNRDISGQFTIKAKFKRVVRKLTVTDNCWILRILLTDDSGDLEVRVDTKLISQLTGYTPSAIMNLQDDIKKKDKYATDSLMKIISGLKQKLENLDGKLVVTFTAEEDVPTLTEIL